MGTLPPCLWLLVCEGAHSHTSREGHTPRPLLVFVFIPYPCSYAYWAHVPISLTPRGGGVFAVGITLSPPHARV